MKDKWPAYVPVFYEAQERAMAPGIAGEWPEIISAPQSHNGRLKRLDVEACKAIAEMLSRNRDKVK